ncbi:enoyl-ACP reductase FabI [Derxia gummosa]|uniref:Enoyl-[acyl-carrier-protein] reductase [NADH] n=1 Tax=Derxia gummosa DSM 723 TaxID=1121388 RepID=A0A8B6X307_9BURK|nr:enoyl-ACP reductase FabI [Derxia gummosa]
MQMLSGMKALVVGVANEHSIAWGCAQAFHAAGAEVALTYLNDKARAWVEPLAQRIGAPLLLPLDVSDDAQMDAVFAEVARTWGRLDVLLHSIAFCPKDDLHGRVVDCSREGFAQAMDISVHSFMRMVKRAEPLMSQGGSCMTVTYYGSTRVVDQYNVMGPVKAALEAVTRELATELGAQGIRVNALSPGPLKTRAASGIDHFDELMHLAAERAPTHQLTTIEEVGAYATFLASPGARNVTGTVPIIDGGFHITS